MKLTTSSLLMFISLLASNVLAQTRPTLTTADVLQWRTANPDRAEHFIPPAPKSQPPTQPTPAQVDAQFLAEEKDWNQRLTEARARVRDFERRANQTDVAAAQLRNNFFHNDPTRLNANNLRVAELQQLAQTLRNEARFAQEEVNRLLDEGRAQGFQLTYIAPRLKDGSPNLEYYRSRFLALQEEIQDEQLRAGALQLRTNRIQTVINTTLNSAPYYSPRRSGLLFYPNNGAGDAFYLNRLRNELGGVSGDLQVTQGRLAILLAQLEELKEEGRQAGVPPGIFR